MRVHGGATVGPWLTVVGLAPDLHQGDRTRADTEPTYYRPMQQRPGGGAWLVAHSSVAAPQSLIGPMRQQIQQADPTVPIWLGPYTLDVWNTGQYWKRAVNGGLFTVFAVMALFLVCLGLLAVSMASVAARRQEIGVRIALGASASDVLRLVAREGVQPALVGLAVGTVISLETNQLLSSQLVEISPWDPTALLAVAVLILTATAVGCLAPALHATRVDLLQAMRGD
jgi:putative ABC transport system permease protein